MHGGRRRSMIRCTVPPGVTQYTNFSSTARDGSGSMSESGIRQRLLGLLIPLALAAASFGGMILVHEFLAPAAGDPDPDALPAPAAGPAAGAEPACDPLRPWAPAWRLCTTLEGSPGSPETPRETP